MATGKQDPTSGDGVTQEEAPAAQQIMAEQD